MNILTNVRKLLAKRKRLQNEIDRIDALFAGFTGELGKKANGRRKRKPMSKAARAKIAAAQKARWAKQKAK